MAKIVCQLGGGGFVKDPEEQMSLLLGHAYTSEHSQSTVYSGTITSIPYLIALYQNRPILLAREIEQSLAIYFQRYFDRAVVVADVINNEKDSEYQLLIKVSITHKGKIYQMKDLSTVNGETFKRVLTEINR